MQPDWVKESIECHNQCFFKLRAQYGACATATLEKDEYESTFGDALDHLDAALKDVKNSDVSAAIDHVRFSAESVALQLQKEQIIALFSDVINLICLVMNLERFFEQTLPPVKHERT